jgi:serine/threonine-protein kinase RsbW
VPKHQTRWTGFGKKILSLYARGMTVREIQWHLQKLLKAEATVQFPDDLNVVFCRNLSMQGRRKMLRISSSCSFSFDAFMKNTDSSGNALVIRVPWAMAGLSSLLDQLERVGERRGWPLSLTNKVMLVLEELVVNAITYGKRETESGFIEVRLCEDGTSLRIDVLDNGVAFDPFSLAMPDTHSDLDSRPVGGLGVFLTKELSTSFSYQWVDGMNHVQLFVDASN